MTVRYRVESHTDWYMFTSTFDDEQKATSFARAKLADPTIKKVRLFEESELDIELGEPKVEEKTITLRAKAKHDVTVTGNMGGRSATATAWFLQFQNSVTYFNKEDWEEEPPPYELPTGLGAVVQYDLPFDHKPELFVRVLPNSWRSNATGNEWSNERLLNLKGKLTTISEGVEL